jgi:hypothetical protein
VGGALILIALAGTILAGMRKARVPARCDICGKTVQSQSARRKRKEFLCSECRKIQEGNSNDQVVEEELEQRLHQIATREGIRRIILGLLVPGSAHYLSGRRSSGVALAFFVFTLLVLVACRDGVIKPIPSLGASPLHGWSLPVFIIVYALYCWRSTIVAIRGVQET